jgi:hypothetical protein
MDAQLRGLIDEYLAAIREALSLFRTHKGLEPDAVMCWREQDELAQQIGYVDATGKIPFFFHGIGCAVHLPAGAVDWDFGHGGRFDGFDAWRLARFAEERSPRHGAHTDWRALEALLLQAEAEGFLERFPDRDFDPLFYLAASPDDAADPAGAGDVRPGTAPA